MGALIEFALFGVAGLVGGLVLLAGVLYLLGKSVPEEHTATSSTDVPVAPADAFALIDNVSEHPQWNAKVTRVEMLEDKNGMPQCRMHMGRNSFVLVRTRHEPARLLERTIADDNGPFGGTWLYQFTPKGSGCEIKLTETGRVKSPLPRAMMKYIFGYHMYLNAHLAAVNKKLGGSGAVNKLR